MDTNNNEHREGQVATMIENQTAKIPSDVFLWSALGSMAVSLGLKIAGKKHEALFVAQELRAQYDCVQPGYHMNKKHWNTIIPDGTVPLKQLKEWIDHSYQLVVQGLPKKLREQFQ